MNFKANNKIERAGGCLLKTLPGLNMDKLVALFPEGKQDACWEPEKGYDHPSELAFEGPDNLTFRVYARYGEPRIGGWSVTPEELDAFEAWLRKAHG